MAGLQDIVYGLDLDVICPTETWLNELIMDHEMLSTAYNIDRCDRVGKVGGGVKTAIKKTPSSTLHEIPSEFSSLEMVIVEISNLKYDRSVLLINFYRPPDNHQQFIQLFAGFLRSLDFGYHYSVIVVGDFNFPGIQWIEGSGFASSGDDSSFENLLMDFYLFQSVEQPTRSNSILDLVLSNTPSFMFEPKTGPQFRESGLSSDHFPVFFDFAVNVNF